MKLSGRVIVELVGGLLAIAAAFTAYFFGSTGFWIGVCLGVGCILLGSAALTVQQFDEK